MLRKIFYTFSIALFSILFIGCKATSPALYPANKTFKSLEEVTLIEKQQPLNTRKTNFELLFKAGNTKPNEDNYVNSRGHRIDILSNPTIVIALPVEENSNVRTKTKTFKTEGYINKAEANVEKELLRFGFSVIDRSKFEAKLRTVRDSSNNDDYWRRQSKLNSEKLSYYERQRKSGNLTEEEYYEKISQADIDGKSRKQGKKEIVDMSELIRAAQMDGVKANYVLQLNKIEEYQAYPETLEIRNRKEIETYLSNNLDLQYGTKQNNISPNFSIDVYRVVFSAKLINVETGKVVWTGRHELNSLNVEDVTAYFNIMKKDIGSDSINKNIRAKNNQMLLKYNKAKADQAKLNSLYKVASQERTYKNKNIQAYKEKALKKDINNLEKNIDSVSETIQHFNNNPAHIEGESKFSYRVSKLTILPNLTATRTSDNQKRKKIQEHREKLLNKTIRSLLNTIKVNI